MHLKTYYQALRERERAMLVELTKLKREVIDISEDCLGMYYLATAIYQH